MKILFIASEAFPLAKVGGLADVASSLAIALHDLGHESCLILPKYRSIKAHAREIPGSDVTVDSMGRHERLALKVTTLKEAVPVYLVENDTYFGTDEIYAQGELERFLFFSQSIPAIIDRLTVSIAIGYVVGGDMDNNALQRAAASVVQESLGECFLTPSAYYP